MVKFLKLDATASQDLTSGALSFTTSWTKPVRIQEIILHASVAITEDVTITRDSVNGANYDAIIRKRSLSSEQDFVFRPDGELDLQGGDNLKVQCTNANTTGIVYLTIKARELN